jgi:NodT family efflux transporter outer membrane factor (OMF) lipoprotein
MLGLLPCACTVGPDYAAPAVAVPAAYDGAQAGGGAQDLAQWWAAFGDPVLDGLIARAFAGNLDLQQAAARVRQARAQEAATRASGGPTVDAVASGSYIRLDENAPPVLGGGGIGGIGLPGEGFSTFLVGFDASWELDVFGGQRRANEAARARTAAAEWSRRDGEVMLAAEVARTYQGYRSLQRRLALADAALASERELLGLIEARAANGLVTSLDPRRQERAIEQLAAQRAGLAAEAGVELHALAVLLGLAPGALAAELAGAPGAAPAAVAVPAGLPSELLLRRPDVRAAERELAAATAEIGVATAELYPKISLTGALQLVSFSLAGLLDNGGLLVSGSGGASLPLIGRGASEATVRLREAQADEALLAYRADVLVALQDVEDALTRLEGDRARVARLRAAVAAADDAADTTRVRYRNGLVAQLEVLEAQQAALDARDALAQAEATAALDLVALYKALGGGWDERRVVDEEGVAGGGQD